MNPWEQLLDVQALDTTLTQLDHRASQLPERAALTEVEAELARVRAETDAAEAEKHELVKGQKRIEDEVALISDKIGTAEGQLYGGGSSDVKQLQALQDEIASFKRRISVLEDDEIELLVLIEPIDERLAALADEQSTLDARAVELTKALAEAESDIEAERTDVRARRADLVAPIAADVLADYEKQKARLGGVAVARLEGGVCGACHMKLSAVENDRIQHLPADEPVECEDCGRFLVRS